MNINLLMELNTNTFTLSFNQHLVFALIAGIFFLLQFIRTRRYYQLIMAGAIFASLLIYLSDSRALFYGVGVLELILLIAALIVSIVQNRMDKKREANS
ncbi:MAG: hypothetical protein IK130_12400 [Oscillospiraceae bacterium]|nr:hypothetical protein [Oscillospiraceae bacterium]